VVPAGELGKPVDLKDKISVTLPEKATEDEKTAWSVGIINTYSPNFVLVHLAMLDHSRFSAEANEAVEKLDQGVGQIIDAELKQDPKARIVVDSDHGFVRVDHNVRVNVLLAKAGLITLRPGGAPKGTLPVQSWDASA
jgi:predicted AlkP superfamily phosphohydrolase/phosphomutase